MRRVPLPGAKVPTRSARPQRRTSSEPSAQSWSPSHFHLPAMQRPLAHENSLSEQGRGAGDREHGVSPMSCQQHGGHRVTQTRGRWHWGQAGVQAEPGELPERGTADTTSQRPPRPTPGPQLPARKWGFWEVLRAASQLHVSPESFSTDGSTSPAGPCCPTGP